MSAVAKTLGRRLFARGAAVGVPMALKTGFHGPPPSPSDGYPLGMNAGQALSPAMAAKQSLMQKIWDALRNGMRTHQEHENLRYVRRGMMGGLDPDLAVLNSMSLQRRVQIQIDREKSAREADRSIRHRIIKGLGGNPEDFE